MTGSVRITGLPFTALNNNSNYAPVNFGYAGGVNITANQSITGIVIIGASYASLYLWDAATGTTELQASELTATSDLYFHSVYQAA